MSAKTVHATLHKDQQLSKKLVSWVIKMLTRNMGGDHDRHGFSTILENVLTVGSWLAIKSKLAGLTHQEASLKELEGVQKMARQWTFPRCSGGNTSAARSV